MQGSYMLDDKKSLMGWDYVITIAAQSSYYGFNDNMLLPALPEPQHMLYWRSVSMPCKCFGCW